MEDEKQCEMMEDMEESDEEEEITVLKDKCEEFRGGRAKKKMAFLHSH